MMFPPASPACSRRRSFFRAFFSKNSTPPCESPLTRAMSRSSGVPLAPSRTGPPAKDRSRAQLPALRPCCRRGPPLLHRFCAWSLSQPAGGQRVIFRIAAGGLNAIGHEMGGGVCIGSAIGSMRQSAGVPCCWIHSAAEVMLLCGRLAAPLLWTGR